MNSRNVLLPVSLLGAWVLLGQCAPADHAEVGNRRDSRRPEATSLLGKPLFSDSGDPQVLSAIDRELDADPDNPEVLLRKGLALEDARRFNEAIDLYSRWLVREPTNVALLRRRGHRYINIRKHAAAVADLKKAAALHEFRKVEHLGYKDNLHWAIGYYLGLAYYLQGNLDQALASFEHSYIYCADKTSLLASTNWVHNILRRLGRFDQARRILEPIDESSGFSGNYYRNILVYKGLRKESDVFNEQSARGFVLGTMGYAMASWRLSNGDEAGAVRLLRRVAGSESWHSNGVMAAEADLAARK
ncbi:MAG: tetratricopeptide repeat protein [Planctomycetota bacterium]|nr:tetratricopeptide repeat protein [Planctomycetota bacterium]